MKKILINKKKKEKGLISPILKKIKIIKEDKDYLIIDKPPHILVHFDGNSLNKDVPTVVDWVDYYYPKIRKDNVGEDMILFKGTNKEIKIKRPGIVHRLDKDTTGLLIIAKSQKGHEYFKGLLMNRKIKKKYLAYVYGHIKDSNFIIDRPIGRVSGNIIRSASKKGLKGKIRDAVTEVEVIERGYDKGLYTKGGKINTRIANIDSSRTTLIKACPLTGRTHQIRVHLKSINHPILSDYLYANKRQQLLDFKRPALHALSLEFEDLSGHKQIIKSKIPKDFVVAKTKFIQKHENN